MEVLYSNNKTNELLCEELKKEQPIIIPTDTNYNLACLPSSEKAIDRIFEYKKREKNKPLSLFFLNPIDWSKYGRVNDSVLMDHLVEKFWPGALNIVIENTTDHHYMLNDSETIALGCIKNKSWRKLMQQVNEPLAITSANISGTADDLLITEEVAKLHMGEKVNYMLKSEEKVKSTKSSTIISLLEDGKIKILREGDITIETLEKAVENWGYKVEKY